MQVSSGKLVIWSGGQTGADRAALDFAIAHHIPHGGWCPKSRKAEDGPIPRRYRLQETASASYAVRTRWNVCDSDGTVVFALKRPLAGGTKLTADLARRMRKPLLVVTRGQSARDLARRLDRFIKDHGIRVLNVAGPRDSEQSGVGEFVWAVLTRWSITRRPKCASDDPARCGK